MKRAGCFAGLSALALVPPVLVALLGRRIDRWMNRKGRRP